MIAAVLTSIAMAPTGSRAPYCRASSPRLARAPSTRLELREGLNEAAVWQWDVDELDSLVREIEAGDATLPARRLLAIALARKGDVPGAEAQARFVLAREAADPSMLFLKGLAHEKRDELVDAVDCYAEVLEHAPDAWRAHFHLAKLHLNVGLVAAAAGHLRATLEVNPDFGPAQDAMSKLSGIDVEALQASFDESLDEMVLGDGPGAAPPEPEPEPFDVASLGELFADPEG